MDDQDHLYNLIKETFLLLDAGDRQYFGQYGLTVPRYYALYHIAEEPGISLSQLSNRMFCDKSNITRIIKGLEGDGYVSRAAHETDGRALRLYLTENGVSILDTVSAGHHAYNDARFACFELTESRDLIAMLSGLKEHLREKLESTQLGGLIG